jgi:hypothetical protein
MPLELEKSSQQIEGERHLRENCCNITNQRHQNSIYEIEELDIKEKKWANHLLLPHLWISKTQNL